MFPFFILNSARKESDWESYPATPCERKEGGQHLMTNKIILESIGRKKKIREPGADKRGLHPPSTPRSLRGGAAGRRGVVVGFKERQACINV